MQLRRRLRQYIVLSALVLIGCAETIGQPMNAAPSASSSSVVEDPLEQVPMELTIEHFSRMTLVGTGFTLGKAIVKNPAFTTYAISYNGNGLTISGVLAIPAGEGPFPLLVLNHGYIHPSSYHVGRGLTREREYLASEGFAVLHPDYRGHGDSDESPDTRKAYDAGIEYAMDVINAVSAIRQAKIEKIDASSIGMLGHSLGGGVTLNILTARPDVAAAAVLYAPVNADAYENFTRWRAERDADDRTIEVLGTHETHPERWNALSSRTHLGNITIPILLFHGTRDKDVPIAWSDTLEHDLRSRGKDIRYVIYDGEGHEFSFEWRDFMDSTATFFREHL